MIAVAPAVMVWIALVTVCRHLIGVTRAMAFSDLFAGRQMCADADIRPFERVCSRRRSEREDKHQTGKYVQKASHRPAYSTNAADAIVPREDGAIIAITPNKLAGVCDIVS